MNARSVQGLEQGPAAAARRPSDVAETLLYAGQRIFPVKSKLRKLGDEGMYFQAWGMNLAPGSTESVPMAAPLGYLGQAAAQVNWCQVRQTIAATARAEEARWTAPNGRKLLENDASQLPLLRQYWTSVPGFGGAAAAAQVAQLSANDQPDGEWSAAFICHVMRTSGVQAAHGFNFRRRHMNYIVGALRNRERADRNRPFWLVDSIELQREAVPEPGDILCFNRCVRAPGQQSPGCRPNHVRTRHSYASLRRQFWAGANQNAPVFGSSHCSIVVGRTVVNGQRRLELIGGNEDNSVRLRSNIPIDARGGIPNPAAHHVFGMIKLIGC
jgi:hypothetical protein